MYRMFYQNVHKYLTLDIINSLQLELQSEFLTADEKTKKEWKKKINRSSIHDLQFLSKVKMVTKPINDQPKPVPKEADRKRALTGQVSVYNDEIWRESLQ